MGLSKIEELTSTHLRNEVHFFKFNIEGVKTIFATNVFKIKEIVKFEDKIVDIFSDNKHLIGIANIRGIVIPVLDLGIWLNGKKSNSKLLMICDFLSVLVAIMISKPIGIKTVSWREFERSDSEKIIGYFRENGEIIEIVDLEKMIVETFPEIENSDLDVEELNIEKLILVADDSKMVLKTLSKILNKMNLKFKLFSNGEELLNYLFNSDPKEIYAIITDLEMPKKSGFEVIKEVKSSDKYSKIPIIVNSTMSGESNEMMAKSLNADGFISKNKPKEIEFYLKKFLNL